MKGMIDDRGGKKAVIDSLIYLEPVDTFWRRINVMKFWSFDDSTSSKVEDKSRTMCFSCR